MKFKYILLFLLFFLTIGCAKRANEYRVIINEEPVKICDKELYITNYSYNNEILIYELIDEINCICNNNC